MKVDIGFEARGTLDVEYGPLRRAVAAWAGIHPSEVNGEDVGRFSIAYEEENGVSWEYAHRSTEEGCQP